MILLEYANVTKTAIVALVGALLGVISIARRRSAAPYPGSLVFLHPNCADGGGGERVLWSIVAAALRNDCTVVVLRYPSPLDDANVIGILSSPMKEELSSAFEEGRLKFHQLSRFSQWMLPGGFMTLAAQAAGTVASMLNTLLLDPPPGGVDAFVDTAGFAFSYPVVRWLTAASPAAAYVHYPVVSPAMEAVVNRRQPAVSNRGAWGRTALGAAVKAVYLRLFSSMYSFAGRSASHVVCNGTWCQRHIEDLWKCNPRCLLPPVNLSKLLCVSVEEMNEMAILRQPIIVNVSQFRPEKQHDDLIRAFHALVTASVPAPKQLHLMGHLRPVDRNRLYSLVALVVRFGMEVEVVDYSRGDTPSTVKAGNPRVVFELFAPPAVLNERLREAMVYAHAMVDEHFGIGVAEGLAAGCLCVAHESAGPFLDILRPLSDEEAEGGPADFVAAAQTQREIGYFFSSPVDLPAQIAAALRDFHGEEGYRRRAAGQIACRQRFEDDVDFGDSALRLLGLTDKAT